MCISKRTFDPGKKKAAAPGAPIYDVDLRQESHGFANGLPVSWHKDGNLANEGKTPEEVALDEEELKHLQYRSKKELSGEVRITLTDGGMPFDPLQQADPDLSLPAEERQVGGLGIFMVKKNMDRVDYVYADGKNILTMYKRIR